MRKPRIGITIGDPYGIGPEIVVKSLTQREIYAHCVPYIIGHHDVIVDALRLVGFDMADVEVNAIDDLGPDPVPVDPEPAVLDDDIGDPSAPRRLWVVQPNQPFTGQVGRYGQVSQSAGAASVAAIERAVELALAGKIDAIVTAPIHKEAINLAGYAYSGHTEILADLTGVKSAVMMLVCGPMRVAHVTTHVALREVPNRITQQRIVRVITLFHEALQDLGITDPRIAVAGLNPHSGEGGLFGDEEERVIIPAIATAQNRGIDVSGPVPGDTVFVALRAGRYDGVVAMYHDQGHIPVKLMGFSVDPVTKDTTTVRGVNVTLGLPVIRTSVDHGTAFDIAGRGVANAESMVDALMLASDMATRRIRRLQNS